MRSEVRGPRSESGDSQPSDRESIHGSRLTIHELRRWGEDLGRSLRAPAIVTLEGELGSGKTTLAQAICRGLGIGEDVTSPTFALVNEYQVEGTTVYHLDLYRLRGPDDLTNVGWDDIINSGQIVLVEWPERAGNRLPADGIRIRLEHIADDDNHRRLTVT